MLRILEEKLTDGSTKLRLDGRLVGQWVEVLRSSCDQVLGTQAQERAQIDGQPVLDLTGVSFADYEGLRLLKQLEQQSVRLINCSPFLREQMKQQPEQSANGSIAEKPATE